MRRTIGLYFRTLLGMPPKVTYMGTFDVIRYLKATGYTPRTVNRAGLRKAVSKHSKAA